MLRKLLLNGNSIMLPPGAEVFKVIVGSGNDFVGFSTGTENSSIKPEAFNGKTIGMLQTGIGYIFPGTTFAFYDNSFPYQNITVIRLDNDLVLNLEGQQVLGANWYSSEQNLFTLEDVGKSIYVALLAN